jgi:hypothetical protein
MSDALAEVRELKDRFGEVQRDVAELKTALAASAPPPAVEQKAAVEPRPAADAKPPAKPAMTQIPAQPAAAPAAAASDAATAKAADPGKPAPALPRVLNAPADAAKAIETGSVPVPAVAAAGAQAAPIVFGPAVVKPAAKPVGILIATGPSVDSLRLNWSLLIDRHADTLKNLEGRFQASTGPDGTTYDLVAGPVKSASEAKKLCAALEAKAVSCKVSDFPGDAL